MDTYTKTMSFGPSLIPLLLMCKFGREILRKMDAIVQNEGLKF